MFYWRSHNVVVIFFLQLYLGMLPEFWLSSLKNVTKRLNEKLLTLSKRLIHLWFYGTNFDCIIDLCTYKVVPSETSVSLCAVVFDFGSQGYIVHGKGL